MKLIDLHADTITALYREKGQGTTSDAEFLHSEPKFGLADNPHQINIPKLKQADSLFQFFVLWLNLEKCHKYKIDIWEHFLKLHNLLIHELDKSADEIELVTDFSVISPDRFNHKIGAGIAVEEGAFITKVEDLDIAYKMGVRSINLVWNYVTHIGTPCFVDQTQGLTKFGYAMVERMQELGIIVDVSHLSDQGVCDVLSVAKKPIMASHSNARALCNHKRNLPDDLIRQIADNGGVIGVGCEPNFLNAEYKTIKIDTMIKHIEHISNIGGIDVIALGNDFDGYTCYTPEQDEIQSIADMPKVAKRLLQCDFSVAQVEKIFYKNALQILQSNG